MRVIAGKYGSRVLKGPKQTGLRPTADRVKEALFNIIGAKIVDADFLDLFAGSGAIGIEALSRGARTAVFNDVNPSSIRVLKENLKILDPKESIRVINSPAEQTLTLLFKEQISFDLIFLDPPFDAGLLPRTIQMIISNRLLKIDGLLAVEHPRSLSLNDCGFSPFISRSYGDINLSFFRI